MSRTYTPKASEIERQWLVVDADGQTLGRLATSVARLLTGKHKPTYTPNLDTGDHVIVINRIKPHTRLVGKTESGLMKMLMIASSKNTTQPSFISWS